MSRGSTEASTSNSAVLEEGIRGLKSTHSTIPNGSLVPMEIIDGEIIEQSQSCWQSTVGRGEKQAEAREKELDDGRAPHSPEKKSKKEAEEKEVRGKLKRADGQIEWKKTKKNVHLLLTRAAGGSGRRTRTKESILETNFSRNDRGGASRGKGRLAQEKSGS